MSRIGLVAVLLLAFGCTTSYVPRANTRENVAAYVERAAALVERNGVDAACTAFHEPWWRQGEWYVFINDAETDVAVCHPVRPDLVGGDQSHLTDLNGVYFVREMSARAAEPGGRGWVDYLWPRPGETTPMRKSVYVVAVNAPDGKRYIVGSGGYDMR